MTEAINPTNFRVQIRENDDANIEGSVEPPKKAGAEDITLLRQVLAEGSRDWVRTYNLVNQACMRVIEKRSWEQEKKPDGTAFESFADFACHAQPEGLGVTNKAAATILGRILKAEKKYREWAELLQRIAAKPGRPPGRRKTLADGEGFGRGYVISTSSGAVDRILLRMIAEKDKNPNVATAFEEVCDGRLTPAAAARRLRWGARASPARKLASGFLMLDRDARVKGLLELFGRLEDDERQTLLAAMQVAGPADRKAAATEAEDRASK